MADSEANTKAPPAEDGKAADAAAVKDENATNGKNGEPPSGSSTKEEDGDKKVTKKEEEDAKEEEETNEEVAKSPARGKPGKKRKSASIATPGEDGESGANPTTNTSNNNQRERRVRKSIEAFNPTDFDKAEKSIVVVTGRGVPLGDLEATRTAVESHAQSADAVALAHRLLFSVRGKVAKKDMVANILAFSGYLPPKQEGVGKDKQDDLDEQYEVRVYSTLCFCNNH